MSFVSISEYSEVEFGVMVTTKHSAGIWTANRQGGPLSHYTVGYHPGVTGVQKKIRSFFSASNMDLATMVLIFPVNSDTQDLFKKNPIEKF